MSTPTVRYPLEERRGIAGAKLVEHFNSLTEKEQDKLDENNFYSRELMKLAEWNKAGVTEEVKLIMPIAPLVNLIYQYIREPIDVTEMIPLHDPKYSATVRLQITAYNRRFAQMQNDGNEKLAICTFVTERLRKNRKERWNLQPLTIIPRNTNQ